jgi:hypothetical protein
MKKQFTSIGHRQAMKPEIICSLIDWPISCAAVDDGDDGGTVADRSVNDAISAMLVRTSVTYRRAPNRNLTKIENDRQNNY